jgi:small conductance mechanosensitive channel
MLLLALCAPLILGAEADATEAPAAVTAADPSIPVEELKLLLTPLTKDQLRTEAQAWQQILQAKAEQIAQAEIAVKRQNQAIKKTQEIQAQAEQAQKDLQAVRDQAEKAVEAGEAGEAEAVDEITAAAQAVGEEMRTISESVNAAAESADQLETRVGLAQTAAAVDQAEAALKAAETAVAKVPGAEGEARRIATEQAKDAADQAEDAADAMVEKATETAADTAADTAAGALAESQAAIEQIESEGKEQKVDLLEKVTSLREERRQIIDRFEEVLAALAAKTTKDDAETQAAIADYQLYARQISGISVDVKDTTSAWIAIKGWLLAPSGGIKLAQDLAIFFGILIAAWFISRLFSSGIHKALKRVPGKSRLLEDFLVKSVRWVTMAIGIVMALAALDVSVGPVLAVVGAAGFVVAFALQDSLSNFASGLMILFFKPFDVGDVVDAGGVSGTVQSMSLVSTTIQTFDNKRMVVPNNRIWNDVITNATGVSERRVDMEFGIGYGDDVDRAHQILEEIVLAHPKVLKEPAPTIRMSALADSSVNFIVRPWSQTGDYWDVFWDVHREVKRRFDAAGIGIPYPQRDVHVYLEDRQVRDALARLGA